MNPEHFAAVLKQAHAKTDKEGWDLVPEGTTLTLYVAHGGVPLNVNRIASVRVEGDILYARTGKKDVFAVLRADLFAVGIEGGIGETGRRAGFG